MKGRGSFKSIAYPTLRNLSWQIDALNDSMLALLDGALHRGIGILTVSCNTNISTCPAATPELEAVNVQFLADIKSLGKQLDETELDDNVGICTFL